MGTLTWTFETSFDGWSFVDASTGDASATRSHVSGAIRNSMVVNSGPGTRRATARNTSSTILASIQNGDTISLDYGASSDSQSTRIVIVGVYTDETEEELQVSGTSNAGTRTLTLTQSKTLDHIRIDMWIQQSVNPGRSTTRDMLEVRLVTVSDVSATPGRLRTPFSFLEEQGSGIPGGDGGGSGGNLADFSADGLFVYLAMFNNLGFPTLVKIAVGLTSDGTVVFEPNAGGRIGVQCGRQNDDHVWIAGQFGGTDVIEKSEDAGSSFTVKDDGIMGTIRTFKVGPGNDERLLVFDGDNGDILETLDNGETWTTINASVTQFLNSLARFSQNLEEIATVNQGGVTDSANYSPNSGTNLEDYQTGVYPNADGTKVVVNP